MFNGPLCNDPFCHRYSPHYPGEYGCINSQVWVCPPGRGIYDSCKTNGNGTHTAGCGCAGDPAKK